MQRASLYVVSDRLDFRPQAASRRRVEARIPKLIELIVVSVVICALAASARAQCCGDCNGDGTVTINELVTAVNNALDACGAATPTPEKTPTPTRHPTVTHTPANGCPFTLTDNSGSRGCGFNGTYNRGCGSALNSVLLTNGVSLTVEIFTMLADPPVVSFGAAVDSAGSAHLLVWSTDGFQTGHSLAGTVQLTDNGSQLIVFPNDPPFMITGCNFVQYVGAYTGNGTVAQSVPQSAAGEQGILDRLRAWLERPIPDLAAH
jgi:hypothetical protein